MSGLEEDQVVLKLYETLHVADGGGVVMVVPREYAEPGAKFALEILEKDKAGRRSLYKQLGLPEDDSGK